MKYMRILPLVVLLVGFIAPVARAGVLLPVYSFTNFPDGSSPQSSITVGGDGNFYGTTYSGGAFSDGVVFRLTTNGVYSLLATLDGTNGANGGGALVRGLDGNIYGTTANGGVNNHGTIFMVATNGTFTNLVSFTNSTVVGLSPAGGLMQDTDGTFYGTTGGGGANGYGVIFKYTKNDNNLGVLVAFANTNGSNPEGTLTRDTNGNFYGTTASGGAFGRGTVFRVRPDGVLTNLASFDGTNGGAPYATLVPGADGNYYGTTANGGTNGNGFGYGTVFLVTTNGALTNLVYFNQNNGANPYYGLTTGPDGNFYGVTLNGGAYGRGTFFQITTNGAFIPLFSFSALIGPYAGLTLAGDGSLYGTTRLGGTHSGGAVFRYVLNPAPPVFQTVTQTNHTAMLTWSALAGGTYQLQYSTNLIQTNWMNLGPQLPATNATANASDFIGPDPQRFYRAVLLSLP